jgi:O-antigen ligase
MNVADRMRVTDWTSQLCVIGLFCLSVTAPAVYLGTSLPFFKIEQLLLPIVMGTYFWLLLAGVAQPIRFNTMLVIGFVFCLCNAISMWYGTAILGHTLVLRDLYELPKVFLPVIFFTIGYEAQLKESALLRLLAFFSAAILLVCLYAWSQFLGLGFAFGLNPYYSPGGHIDIALQYEQRVYATTGNSNVLGQLMTWCVVLLVLAALFRAGNTLRNILVALACLITLSMTGSRYGLLTVGLGFVLIIFSMATTRRNFAKFALILVLLPAFAWIYEGVAASNRKTLERYQTLENPLRVDSFRERIEGGWLEAWNDFKVSPVFGHGPSKARWQGRVIDSEFLDVLREKGSLGFLVFLGYYIYPLYLIWSRRRRTRATTVLVEQFPASFACLHAAFIMGILALVMDIGMVTFYTPFLQGFLWLWLGVGASCAAKLQTLSPAQEYSYAAPPLQPQHTLP